MPIANILIVEDEAVIAMDIKRTLQKLNFEVTGIADTGEKAIRLAEETNPDLILMDIVLKGNMDGIDTALIILKNKNIPIVYLSAHHDNATIERSKVTNPYGYLLKPMNERDLNSCLKTSLYRYDAEKKIKESEMRFKALTDVALCTIIIIRGDKFVYVNPYAEVLTGYTFEEIIRMNFWDIVHPDYMEMVKQRGYARQKGEDIPSTYEFKIITKSGSEKWVQVSAIPTDFEGQPCILSIVFDITDRKNAEEVLKMSEEKFRAVAESTPAQIVIFQGDKFIYANPYSEFITGYSEEELKSKKFWDIIHPDFAELARKRGQARQNGESVVENYELKIITKSNSEKWLNYSAQVIDYNGKPAVLGIATDITESKKIREDIEESRQRYKAFIQQSSEGIFRTEVENPIPVDLPEDEQIERMLNDSVIAECNDVMAKMYGYKKSEDIIGRKLNEFLLKDDPGNIQFLREFINNDYRINDVESAEVNKIGENIYFSNSASGVIENGKLARVWGIQIDITTRKKMEKKLAENVEYSNILNYFSSSLLKQTTVDEILWDVTQNCFSKLSFADCVIYLVDEKNNMLLQKAAYGRKIIKGYEILDPLHLKPGEGIVGSVALSGKAEIIPDTSVDPRYIADGRIRLSEITVPIINEGKVIGVIDSEHPDKGFFTDFHLNILESIASLCSVKIVQAMAQEEIQQSEERYRTFVEQSTEGIFRLELKEPVSTDLPVEEQAMKINNTVYIAECNNMFAKMYGEVSPEYVIGKNPADLKLKNIKPCERDMHFIRQGYRLVEDETVETDDEGRICYFVINSVGIIKNNELVSIWGVQRNVTEKKLSEEALKKSLTEKDILLKEIHHRVKNNLQIVTSLLKLQSSYVDDEKVKQLFKESQNRVQSMSLIHQKLYQSRDIAHISFKEYIEMVSMHLQHSYGILEDRIKIRINAENINLSIDNAIPAGLIINELVSNSFKHAFPGGRSGNISISLLYNDNNKEYLLTVKDDGIGIPKDYNFKTSNSFGLKLVSTLAVQMGGTIEVFSESGSEFRINFIKAEYKDRNN